MKITNRHGLPDPLVRAVAWSDRDREGCDYTVTELLRPARIAALERKHADELEEDASDRIWALMGSAGHEVLRRSAQAGFAEERAIAEVLGKKVGGQIDYCKDSIWDYKFTSVWAVKDGPRKEWEDQLNCYRWLALQYGVHIEKLTIVAILRDWSKLEAGRDASYPQSQVKVFDLPLWSPERALAFIEERIKVHEAAKETLPLCTSEETWERPTKWAVVKRGATRAVKLYDTPQEASRHILAAEDHRLLAERRPGSHPRCADYCSVSKFCEQYQEWKRTCSEALDSSGSH